MNKLTVFTVVLSIVVVTVVSEVLFSNYFGNVDEGKVDVLTSQSVHPSLVTTDDGTTNAEGDVVIDDLELQKLIEDSDIEKVPREDKNEPTAENTDTPADIEILSITETGITNETLQLAKFPDATLVTANFDGSLFQTIDVSDLSIEIKKQYVASNSEVFGAIYSFSVDEGAQNELYRILRERAAFGSSVEINETNTFGDNSFYMNDSKRQSTAFLVIRKGVSFYSFAYPKEFNSYFKALAQSF
jgi:hypothetical protein